MQNQRTYPLLSDKGGVLREALGIKGNLFGVVPYAGQHVWVHEGGLCIQDEFSRHGWRAGRVCSARTTAHAWALQI